MDVDDDEEAGLCPVCGHDSDLHPGAILIRVCAYCIAEEDHDERDESDMCRDPAPGTEDRRASHWLAARIERPLFRAPRVVVSDDRNLYRRKIRPDRNRQIDEVLARVQDDLQEFNADDFDAKYGFC